MTDDASDTAIGRTVTEYRDKKSRLIALRTEFVRAADALRALSDSLRNTPELLDFGGDPFPSCDIHRTRLVDTKYLDRESLHAQVKDYRTLKEDTDKLAGQIKEFGLTP